MTSVRTCYCKEEENALRTENNNLKTHNKARQSITSKKSIAKNEICGNNGRYLRRVRRVTDEKMPDTSRSIETRPPDSILSPETSTALENAETIVNNAKIQLMEVCALSGLDSARCNGDIYSDDPPLDDDAEELIYIRQLVASKFHETNSHISKPDVSGKKSARSERFPKGNPQLPSKGFVRKVDLSAPKFRTLRRRPTHRGFLERRSDRQRSPRYFPPAEEVRSSRESSSKDDSNGNERQDEITTRDDRRTRDHHRRPSSSAAQREPDGIDTACRIQKGPCVHVDGELTRQDLEDMHISPEPSFANDRANTAIYTLRHDNCVADSRVFGANLPEVSELSQAKLGTSRKEKRGGLVVTEVIADAITPRDSSESRGGVGEVPRNENSIAGRENERIEPLESPFHDRELVSQDVEDTSKRLERREATDNAALEDLKTANGNQIEIISRDDKENRLGGDGGRSAGKSNVGNSGHSRDKENTADRIQTDNRDGKSSRFEPSFDGDVRRKNVTTPRCPVTENSSRPYQTIEKCLSDTFNSHDARRDEQCDDLVDIGSMRRPTSVLGSNWTDTDDTDDPRAENDTPVIELYQPCLNELDSILLSNERKIEHIARATNNIAALLSKPEFARYRLDGKGTLRDVSREESYDESLAGKSEKSNGSPRISTLEVELRNRDLTVSSVSETTPESDARSRGRPAAVSAGTTKTSSNAQENGYPKNSAESAKWVTSDGGSSIGSFSDMPPALSSTRTEAIRTCRRRHKRITRAKIDDRHEDTRPQVTSASKSPERAIDGSPKRRADHLFARIIRSWNTGEAMDRFVACILQDEKHSVERNVTSALRESAIAPKTLRQILDRLREVVSIDDACRNTDTLNMLKDILLDIKHRNDANAGDKSETEATKIRSRNVASIAQTEESTPRVEIDDVNEIVERIVEDYDDLKNHESLESSERRKSIRSAARSESVASSRNGNERRTYRVNTPKNISDSVNENLIDEVIGNGKGIHLRDVVESANVSPPDAIEEEWSPHEAKARQTTDNASVAEDPRGPDRQDVRPLDLSEPRETQLDIRIAAVPFEPDGNFKNNSGSEENHSSSKVESLKRISEINSDDEESLVENFPSSSSKTAPARSKEYEVTIHESASKNKRDNERDERGQVDASFGETLVMGNVNSMHPLTEKIRGSTELSTNDGNFNSPQDPTVSEGVANPPRNCAPLRASSSGESFKAKEVESRNRETSLEDNPVKAGEDEICGDGNRKGENVASELSKNVKRDQERSIASANAQRDSSFDSTSSLNDTPLEYDGRSSEGAFSTNTKDIGTSPEISHSEGELYMPSSCSYSLGEVRILDKCDLIADSSIDRDSSVTVLVTRSMLTSLNDSMTSPLSSSGRI